MALKPIVMNYSARNFATALADVKGQVYVDGVAKAVSTNAISFTELDSANAPGIYVAVISAAMLATYGAVAGSVVEVYINSASKPAAVQYKEKVTAISTDDLDAHLTTQDGVLSSIQTTGVDTNTKVSAIKADLETGSYSLQTLAQAISAVQSAVGTIQNTVAFSASIPEPLVRPGSGSNMYRIPIRLFNDAGQMADADSNAVSVQLVDQAGVDRSSYLTGATSGAAPAIRSSKGVYYIDLSIPSTAVLEGLQFTFTYAINAIAFNQGRAGSIVSDVQADGFALQSTLLSVQTTAQDSNTVLRDPTVGLAAANTLQSGIQALLQNGTYGLSALQALLGNGSYGLSALQALINQTLSSSQSNGTQLAAVEGSGFNTSTDSLQALSSRIYTGGRAV